MMIILKMLYNDLISIKSTNALILTGLTGKFNGKWFGE